MLFCNLSHTFHALVSQYASFRAAILASASLGGSFLRKPFSMHSRETRPAARAKAPSMGVLTIGALFEKMMVNGNPDSIQRCRFQAFPEGKIGGTEIGIDDNQTAVFDG